ncbi:glucosidase II beta subunit-like-domain-containing protein [Auriculariales sp. MPI-PUGE-AT-0066]|nr:glucosidase II beta subunit-like-domain-containing protein [Auriculariales sp. MPI-PUGE-AT-0066]
MPTTRQIRRQCLIIVFLVVVVNLALVEYRRRTRPYPVLGVNPAQHSLYAPVARSSPPMWRCLDSSKVIQYDAVNDDYCDCADGSDEPGTSACRDGTFFCLNDGGDTGRRIPSYSVSDGLCEPDCCDGSDEPLGVCPNTCSTHGLPQRDSQLQGAFQKDT